MRRAGRLVDAHTGALGDTTFGEEGSAGMNVPASQFLRPYAGPLAPLHPLHRSTVMRGMTQAARRNRGYHLWWHPHNFGRSLKENLDGLSQIIGHFTRLREAYGMGSCSMSENTR